MQFSLNKFRHGAILVWTPPMLPHCPVTHSSAASSSTQPNQPTHSNKSSRTSRTA